MKIAITLLAFVAAAVAIEAGPVSIQNNNVGDIVTVNVDANAVLSSNIESNIVTVLLALLNQQAAIVNGNLPEGITPTDPEQNPISGLLGKFEVTPEMIETVKNVQVTPDLVEKIKSFLKKE
ncbi:hypothetical protein PVAND_010786 [Polypedilum vanderplanki]|uniref:Uncharacterized protein n=1 Tax=Polypedilum vanderplanki TaxID=319348 RepID=A0A9J6CHB9_POLVA|nr:hypothetical protein PVAND_010786 [Polypedilum vanderplanki]